MNIKLKNDTSFAALDNRSILESARQAGIVLEHSCRTGRCGVCKVKVISGETDVIQAEESLRVEDEANGFILTCCRAVKTDLQLDIGDLGELGSIQTKTLPCRIDSLQPLSDDVVEVVLRTPPTSRLEYLPGQYVDMIGKDGLRRSYSVANAPREDGKITLQIRKVEQGKMSQYWFEDAKANDLLRMEGPLGTFCLRKSNAKQLILLATGTGIAPIKAILEQLSTTPVVNTYNHIHLYWGGRIEQDIYWQPVFESLPLTFTPVLSRTPEWQGRKGYIQDAVIDDSHDLRDAVVYACGSEAMIHSAHEQLVAAGLNSEHFYADAFVSSN
ncbi:MAG: 2Fe-2S iron-sulfur cluster binding domain-containing protein [Oceanospirillaceae bacterium]|nr:2Fe-2S iron-sulfur cluster binding domain-containing protein [Oceanospirillaceae bacterium]